MDNVLSYNNFDVLKNKFEDKNLRQTVRLLCVFGCGAEEVIFATNDDKVYGFGRNRFGGLGLGTLEEHIQSPQLNKTLSGKQVINIFCGFEHWIALTDSGQCFAWGHNESGQLGVSKTIKETQTPHLVNNMADNYVIDVSCGGFFTLALTCEGRIYGWGHNQFGQLGDTSYTHRYLPVITLLDSEVCSISCGIKHAMALTFTGEVYIWGLNSSGQLGLDKSQTYVNRPKLIPDFEGIEISKAVCGPNHSLVLTSEGSVFSFGENSGGQIGNGGTDPQLFPYNVEPDVKFKDIIGHKENDISIAVSVDEKFYIWGLAKNRRLLTPKVIVSTESVFDIYAQYTKKSLTFKTVIINETLKNWEQIDPNRNYSAIDCISDHSFDAKDTEASHEKSWTTVGRRDRKNSQRSSVSSVLETNDNNRHIKHFVDLKNLEIVEMASLGRYANDIKLLCVFQRANSVIYITKDDKVYGFGHNRNGALGLGHWKEDLRRPELNAFLSHQNLIDIVWGFEHCVGLTSSGQCLSWGRNGYGQLGQGSNQASHTPQIIKEFSDKSVVQVCCGSYHTIALTSDGELFSWGHNTFAQLGDRTYNSRDSPTQILIKDKVLAIACGLNHSLALTTDGSVYVWGVNELGQLGRPREKDVRPGRDKPVCNRPQRISYLDNIAFKKIICGSNHSLLLASNGQIFSFGDNSCGQIGNGSTDTQFIPFKINCISNAKDIIANRENDLSIAVTEDNRIYVWGSVQNRKVLKPEPIDTSSKTSLFDIYVKIAKNKVTFKMIDINEDIDKYVITKDLKTKTDFISNVSKLTNKTKIDINSRISEIMNRFGSDFAQEEDKESECKSGDEEYFEADRNELSESDEFADFKSESNYNQLISNNDQSFGSEERVISPNTSYTSVGSSRETTAGDIFLRRLRQSFNNPNNYDLKVISGDQVIYCHKTILQIRNEKFWQTLSEHLSEEDIWSTHSEVTIDPMKCPAFYAFLQFMYGIEPTIDVLFIRDLINLAQFCEEPDLEELCAQLNPIIYETIDETNICSLYEKAITEGLTDLENSCVEFAANNWKNVCKSDTFQTMDDKLSKRLMMSAVDYK